ncbi:hypothetical protein TRFO_32165 [Tritrichomonas foetus]|uniref:Uncharacterized protein n=1 Tax=Tritrichomonas foetus TaxID=1144522 RepID=A0A1J4JP81_9EUKA|nr:hypothetical protein TRFO_32165 [Tritrichomonas foetus]|eukprot:OHT00959.1 hypothetical protein TRFO_32165 [Tritrichomonas foetus]
MNDYSLDIIIGQSPITRNKFSSNYKAQACAFPSGGFLSIVTLKDKARHDIILSETTTEISAISFSKSGNHIAVGESGPSSRVFILSFDDDDFNNIPSKIVVNTKEKGFSCIALDSDNGKLITIGCDQSPFLLLWDLKKMQPTIIGHYRLPTIPTHLSIGENIALVSGDKMLKVINLSVDYTGTPSLLSAINANIGNYKTSRFVSVACSSSTCYALTSNGVICSFGAKNITKKITLKIFNTNRGNATSMSIDDKLLAVGTVKGSILGIKRETPLHLFGQFLSAGKSVVAVGVLSRSIVAAYSDGYILFWRRKLNTSPTLSISSPRGPICAISIMPDDKTLFSVGNDGFIRKYLIKTDDSGNKSTQELIGESQLNKFSKNMNNFGGIRCLVKNGDHLYCGDDNGLIYKIDSFNLDKLMEIKDNNESVLCIAAHPTLPLIATGGGDGSIRIYNNASSSKIFLSMTKQLSSGPIHSLVFTQTSLVAASNESVIFCRLPDLSCEVFETYTGSKMFMSLVYVPQAQLVLATCQDMYLYTFCVFKGKVFRRYKLSNSDFPVCVAEHPTGLIYAVAMSDGYMLIVDAMSGDVVLRFQTHAGMITNVIFHKNDLIISSFGGCLMRWKLPFSLHKALENSNINSPPNPEQERLSSDSLVVTNSIFRSIYNSKEPPPCWIFNEISEVSVPQVEEEIEGPAGEDDSHLNQQSFNEDNLNQQRNNEEEDEEDDKVANIFRRSFCKVGSGMKSLLDGMKLLNKKNASKNENIEQSNKDSETKIEGKSGFSEKSQDDSPNKSTRKSIEKLNRKSFEQSNNTHQDKPSEKLNDHQNKNNLNDKSPEELNTKTQADEINELRSRILELMGQSNLYLNMKFTDGREISAQNELKKVVDEFNQVDEEFEAKYKKLSSYASEMMMNAHNMMECVMKSQKMTHDISSLIDTL